ncbi:glycosyltransferase family 4 protein [Rugosimonospora africana]|uniref:Glycosyl transferase family 1 n=1 Tax=Rugosimonospora africana TaxID=556532 RepID=A0A8J3QY77_9ACTN|nr:glycosyltransferase family 4 protein [Rugosimonospora africana]GIH18706.1 glycosyl transferase family 1 [Rugosimonospora africana]
MSRTLMVTNDFPPRSGGIQRFVHNLAVRQPAGSLVVYASTWPARDPSQAAKFDAAQPFEVIRENTGMLLPTPGVARRAAELARSYECDSVWFGAAAPLGLLAHGLRRRAGIVRAVAQTHGHEAGWAALPGARGLLRRIGDGVDVVTYLGNYFRTRLAPVLADRTELVRLAPGVDTDSFHPDLDGSEVRARYGLTDRPVIVCVSRLVPRKGQDMLIRALPEVRRRVPDAALLIVSGGPYGDSLRRLARDTGVADHVVFTGEVAWPEVPLHFAAGDVFAMPCRTRHRGLDVEGLGMVYLEASATGLPVLAGDSGGAPDAVRDGETGFVVNGRDVAAIADPLATLLGDPALCRRMGAAGRAWVDAEWRWDLLAERMSHLLRPAG